MATVTRSLPSSGIVMEDVTWADYEAQLRIIGNRHIRVNYDDGRMEIMSPVWRHGNGATILGWMIAELVVELNIQVEGADPVTLKRPDIKKGVEPDRLFYFGENAARVQENHDLNLTVDPPPDLVIEVNVTSSSVPRLPIFAALGIPEIWRLVDDELEFLHLQADGTYQAQARSRAFPALRLAEATRFLEQGQRANKTVWIKTFRAFVRDVLVPRDAAGPENP